MNSDNFNRRLTTDEPISGAGCTKSSLEQHTPVRDGSPPSTRRLATPTDPQPADEPHPIVVGGVHLLAIGICGFIMFRFLRSRRPKRPILPIWDNDVIMLRH